MTRPFVDTSALAKRYLPEAGSDAFEAWFSQQLPVIISRLTIVELTSLLHRRLSAGQLSPTELAEIEKEFDVDLADGLLQISDLPNSSFHLARRPIVAHARLGLRTLDGLQVGLRVGKWRR